MIVKLGTFNLLNLALPGEKFYDNEKVYSQGEYDKKIGWIAEQLRRMDADVVGFQEVWHEEALREAAARSGVYEGATVVAPRAEGAAGPYLGLVSRLPVIEVSDPVVEFPLGLDVPVDGIALPVGNFSRPVLRARVRLDRPTGFPPAELSVFVAHLKSKRPLKAAAAKDHDPLEEALGKARSLVRRAAEAAALRFLLLAEIVDNRRPVVVLGDLNDDVRAVTTDIVMGDDPFFLPPGHEQRPRYWDRLLYSAHEIHSRLAGQHVSYSHVYNGQYQALDHILVTQEFFGRNPDNIGDVIGLRYFNDHVVDSRLTDDRSNRVTSDHGQLVAEIRLRRPR